MAIGIKKWTLGVTLPTVFALVGCLDFSSAKEEVEAKLTKLNATEETSECENYKTQYVQTGDEEWKSLYDKNCKEDFVKANTPEGLSTACEADYEAMLIKTDSTVASTGTECRSEADAQTKTVCKNAMESIEVDAKAFGEKCDTEDFYYADFKDVEEQKNDNGECVWDAWIPEDTREAGQDSVVQVLCMEKPPECVEKTINKKQRHVEIHKTPSGDEVFLPCVEQFVYGTHPCDSDNNGVVSKYELEAETCKEHAGNPCDFNGDGKIDPFETEKCTFANDSGFVDGTQYDPCDYNFDGRVDKYEKSTCGNVSNCTVGEVPFWDHSSRKDVCVNENKIPNCLPPLYPDIVSGVIACVSPCDVNRDGMVDQGEKDRCNFVQCKEGETPFFDPANNKDVCVNQTDMPNCNAPMWPEYFNGKFICVDPCDFNRDSSVDEFEKSSCTVVQCNSDEISMWDQSKGIDVCIKQNDMLTCNYPSTSVIVGGTPMCSDPCDSNFDGKVDSFEKNQCANSNTFNDPCDFNKDGKVDPVEMEKCAVTDPCEKSRDRFTDSFEEGHCNPQ
jgi:hypothetical protein